MHNARNRNLPAIKVPQMDDSDIGKLIGQLEELERDDVGAIKQQKIFKPRVKEHPDLDDERERLENAVAGGKERINRLQAIIANSIHDEVDQGRALRLLATMLKTQALLEEVLRLHYEQRRRDQRQDAAYNTVPELTRLNRMETAAELSACIAHEVNQPLTAIVANAAAALRWLRKDAPDLNKVRECLTAVEAIGLYAGDVLRNTRAMFNNNATEQTPVDINELIQIVLSLVRSDLTENEIALETQLSEDIPLIRGNPVQLQQVLMDLVTNAVQSMLSVNPRVLRVRSDLIKTGTVHVSIEDTGTRIESSNLDRIFNPLINTKPDGMGLGLAMCRSIVERHNGRIWVSAGVHRGSNFQFELPANERTPDLKN